MKPTRRSPSSPDSFSASVTVEAPDALPAPYMLRNEYGFVVSFGIPLASLSELHVYRGAGTIEQLPPKVAALLRKLYDQGSAIGPAIMALLHQGRDLRADEAIYVAVVDNTSSAPKQIKTFIATDPG